MSDRTKALAEGLMKAVKAEREGHSFYMMAANSTGDAKGKEVFARLAAEELDHMDFLRRQYESVLKTGRPDHSAKLGPRADLSGSWPIFTDRIKQRIQDAHFEMTALSIGIQLELDAMNFYKSQAESSDDREAKRFYAELADWESGHYRALLTQQEALKEDYWSAGGFSPF